MFALDDVSMRSVQVMAYSMTAPTLIFYQCDIQKKAISQRFPKLTFSTMSLKIHCDVIHNLTIAFELEGVFADRAMTCYLGNINKIPNE